MTFALLLAALLSEAPQPEACITASNTASVSVSHEGKTYRLASEACRAQFLSDPERYAQLYDALLELQASGTPLAATTPSLVPS